MSTLHDACEQLKAAMTRHRKVLGSLPVEWVKFDQAEMVVDQLITMYRELAAQRERALDQLRLSVEQCERSKQILDLQRERYDQLQQRVAQLTARKRRRK